MNVYYNPLAFKDGLTKYDQEQIENALHKEDYAAALSILSSVQHTDKPTEAMKLNELFLSSLLGEDDYLEGVQFFLSEFSDISMTFFIDVMSDAIYVAGKKNNISAMQQLFECVYNRISQVYPSVRVFPKRVIDVCCYVLAFAQRFSLSSPILSSMEADLSANALIIPLSPLQYWLVCRDSQLQINNLPPSIQSFRGQEQETLWLQVHRYTQNGDLAEASEVLLQLLQHDEQNSLFILYDIILLTTSIDSQKVVSLQQLFLIELKKINETMMHHIQSFIPLVRPASLPSWSLTSLHDFKSFFLQQMMLIALQQPESTGIIQQILQNAPSSLLFTSIRGFLQALTDHENETFLDGVTDPLLRWIQTYLTFRKAYQQKSIGQCRFLLQSLQEGLSMLPHQMQDVLQPFLNQYHFVIHQVDESDLVFQQASQLMDKHCKQPLLADAFTTTDFHVFNVCIALLKRQATTRCCVLWAKYWNIDVVQMGNSEWYEQREKEAKDALKDCVESHRCLFQLHLYVLLCWHELMLREGVMRQVLAMEVHSALYHTLRVCLYIT